MALFLLLVLLPVASLQDRVEVKVKAGEDVTLECHSATDAAVSLLEWSRPDLDSGGYIFFYRDERVYVKFQHLSFVDRVKLRDPEMKHGDVSVILRNVTVNDTGRYECYVSVSGSGRARRDASDVSKTIELVVEDSGITSGHTWAAGGVGGAVAAVLGFAAAGVGAVLKQKTHMKQTSVSSEDEASDQQLV